MRRKRIRIKKGQMFPYDELWSLDLTLAKIIYPRLVAFKRMIERNGKGVSSYPTILDSFEQWLLIIDKMIYSFRTISNEEWVTENFCRRNKLDFYEEIKKQDKLVEEGLSLFAKYFRHLWD